jgi:hypothetical protein
MANEVSNTATAGASGNWFNDVTSNLLKLVDQGAQVYNTINNKTQGAASQVANQQAAGAALTSTGATKAEATYYGFTKTQWLVIGGGVAVVATLLLMRRR